MRSTFHGLETAKRAMFAQQSALYTTGNNIANANTPGYTRQRVNFNESEAYPPASMNRPQIPGQMGTGVSAGSVQRVREFFLDTQFRNENAKLGYYGANAESLTKLEGILNEVTEDSNGISKVLNDFWQSLQDLSVHPENDGAKEVVIQRGHAVADTFNYVYNTIDEYRDDLLSQITHVVGEPVSNGESSDQGVINTILDNIHQLNEQIEQMERLGSLPNSLYDERDRLVDELSEYFTIEVERKVREDVPKEVKGIAEGMYTIKVAGQVVVDESGFKPVSIEKSEGSPDHVTLKVDGNSLEYESLPQGKIKSLIENYGYSDGKGTYVEVLADLSGLAKKFIDSVNGAYDGETDLFRVDQADNIRMVLNASEDWRPGTAGETGDGSYAREIADSFEDVMKDYEKLIGNLGVKAQYANRQKVTADTLRSSVEENRLSISTVSLDEEMINIIKFQHAYNAAARNITVVDEMLDRIINGMGLVGR